MTMGYDETLRNARLNLVRDAIDDDTDPGTITIYSGTRPDTGAAVTTQVALSVGTFSDPSAPDADDGELVFDTITYTDALADGTATWARIADGADNFVADADVGGPGSGADVVLNSTGLVEDGPVTHVSAKITAGNP